MSVWTSGWVGGWLDGRAGGLMSGWVEEWVGRPDIAIPKRNRGGPRRNRGKPRGDVSMGRRGSAREEPRRTADYTATQYVVFQMLLGVVEFIVLH